MIQQLQNLRSFSFVRERLDKDLLQLHGLWFDIGNGDTHMFCAEQKKFIVVNEETVQTVFSKI